MLTSLMSLWLPIILSGIALFFASWLAWTVLPHHKGEWKPVPDEENLLGTLRQMNVSPGQYTFPHCHDQADFKSEDYQRRLKGGPIGTMTVWNGPPNMGRNML